MAILRSGDPHMSYGFLRSAGLNGRYWSRDSAAATTAYALNFNDSGVDPSNGPRSRYFGFSLRCLQE